MPFQYKNTNTSKAKRWERIYHVNTTQKKAKIFIIISDKVGFRVKNITKDKESNFIIKRRLTKRT